MDLAFQYYSKALNLNRLDDGSFLSRANIYADRKDYKKAIEDYDQSIAIKPSIAAYTSRGWAYAAIEAYDKGLTDLNQAISMDSTFLDAYRNRGFLYERAKRYNEALQDFRTCSLLQPGSAEIICQVGVVYYELQDWANAYAYFDQACGLAPTVGLFYLNRGKCSQNMGNTAAAEADMKKAEALGVK